MGRISRFFTTTAMCMILLLAGTTTWARVTPEGVHITVMHTNDMHSRVQAGDDNGKSLGIARIAGAARTIRHDNAGDSLLLDAGDTLHGMPIINISQGSNMVSLLNEAGYDAMVPGNHDYNYGSARLVELSKELDFPVLSANTIDKRTGQFLFPPYKIYSFHGVKVAVFGLTTAETVYKTRPDGIQNIRFLDPVAAARRMVKQLRQDNDVLIALTHLGIDKSSAVTTDMLVREVPGIDIVIDGHSHTELPQGMTVGNTLIAQTGCYDHYLGEVQLLVKNHQIISKEARLLNDKDLDALGVEYDKKVGLTLQEIEQKNSVTFNTVVTHNSRTLSGERTLVRAHEAELGNLAADAMRWKAQADVALVNGGGIRADLKAGPVTKGDIMSIFPFGNVLYKVRISGTVLQQVLEQSVSQYPALYGGFQQVSGITFSFDPSRNPGQRVSQVLVGGTPLVLQKEYTVAINDFAHLGGDGFSMFIGTPVVGECGTCEEALADYLNQVGVQDIALGRIHMEEAAQKAA